MECLSLGTAIFQLISIFLPLRENIMTVSVFYIVKVTLLLGHGVDLYDQSGSLDHAASVIWFSKLIMALLICYQVVSDDRSVALQDMGVAGRQPTFCLSESGKPSNKFFKVDYYANI